MLNFDVVVLGGGAAGYFTAINLKEKSPMLKVCILEKGKEGLTKVKISGGGRCNVTHACYEPIALSKHYPRGEKELKSPFYQFNPEHTIDWFNQKGIAIKEEVDGRMFPISNSSQTIIDCFVKATQTLQISVFHQALVQKIETANNNYLLHTSNQTYQAKNLVIATGSNPKIWDLLKPLGHQIIPAVPSLFTFNVVQKNITNLMGISHQVSLKILNTKLTSQGPLLITHWGLSGPAILKLSSWGARELFEYDYQFKLMINWTMQLNQDQVIGLLKTQKELHPKQTISKHPLFDLKSRLWQFLLQESDIEEQLIWANCTKKQLHALSVMLTMHVLDINGKSTFKEEFVTAGGVDLKQIDFRTMQSKLHPNLFFAGEVLNIDAITGGFNFQNCWTAGWIISEYFKNKRY